MNKNKFSLILILFFLAYTTYAIAAATTPPTPPPQSSPFPTPAATATTDTPPPAFSSPSALPTTTSFSSPSPPISSDSSENSQLFKDTPLSTTSESTEEIKNSAQIQAGEKTSPSPPHNQSRYVYSSVRVSGPYIAITFDDGPHPSLTPKLLDMLKARGIKATFFLIGENVAHYPNIVKRMVNEGHEVASHTWSHPALTKCSSEKFNHEIKAANEAIEAAAGVRPTLIRPPYGATNPTLNRILHEKFGLKVILWSVDPEDWRYRNAARVANYIPPHTKQGDIILAHDIHATTVEAMPKALDELSAKGLKFLTVSELIAHQTAATPTPASYHHQQPQQPYTPAAASQTIPPSPLQQPQQEKQTINPSQIPITPPPAIEAPPSDTNTVSSPSASPSSSSLSPLPEETPEP